jgi:hypothetical protein
METPHGEKEPKDSILGRLGADQLRLILRTCAPGPTVFQFKPTEGKELVVLDCQPAINVLTGKSTLEMKLTSITDTGQ